LTRAETLGRVVGFQGGKELTVRPRFTLMAALWAIALAGCASGEAEPLPANGILECREGDLLFTYHLITDSESLFDVKADPECLRNLAGDRPEDTARLRNRVAARYGVDDIATLRESRHEEIEHLEQLGYL